MKEPKTLPVTLPLGAPTGLRPAGFHRKRNRATRAAVKLALRKGTLED